MTDPTDHDAIADLLGAYALHAVDADEAALVEAHLAECPRCRAEVADHREVAALLGNSGGAAPDGLWDRIVGALEETAPPMRLALPEGPASASITPIRAARRPVTSRIVVSALAAAAAVVIAVLGVKVVQQEQELDEMQAAMVDDALLRAANAALLDPAAVRADLASPDGGLAVSAVLLPDGSGYLMAQDLPALPADRTYQLWGKTPAGLVSLGVLGGHPEVVPFHSSGAVAALAVTEEQAGGVIQSKNPPTVIGTVA